MPRYYDPNAEFITLSREAIQGTPEATNGAAVFQLDNVNKDIGKGDKNIIRFGKDKKTNWKNRLSGLSGSSVWKFSDAAGTPSVFADFFRICGMDMDTTDPAQVKYVKSVLSQMDSGTLRTFNDISDTETYMNLLSGVRGVLGFEYVANEPLKFLASFLGEYHQPSKELIITPDWGTQKTNISDDIEAANIENNALQLDNKNFCLVSAKTDNALRMSAGKSNDTCAGSVGLYFADATLTLVYKVPDYVTEFHPNELQDSERLIPFKMSVGTVAGKRIALSYSAIQAGQPSFSADDKGVPICTQPFDIESDLEIIES